MRTYFTQPSDATFGTFYSQADSKNVRPSRVAVAAAAAAILGLAACNTDGSASGGAHPGAPVTIVGESKPMGSGTVYSWAQSDAGGQTTSFGVSFNDAALNGLGPTPTEIVLALPAGQNTSLRTAVINWNPQGHPPAHVYDVPHFDFHFYAIDEATRMSIAPSGAAAQAVPASDIVPAGFSTDGATVPMMGKHYISGAQPEFHGGTFTATPIYGYWNGHLAFVESMLTIGYLQTHPSLTSALAQPIRFEQSGRYPTQWAVNYVAAAHRYDITFGGLANH